MSGLIARHYSSANIALGKMQLVEALGTEVGDRVPPLVDFLFIDADHSVEAIRLNWKFWNVRVRPGGIIAVHDTLFFR